jgi:hypothetical protein
MARGGPPKGMQTRRMGLLESITWTVSSGERFSQEAQYLALEDLVPGILGRTPRSARVPMDPLFGLRNADEGVGCGPGGPPHQES